MLLNRYSTKKSYKNILFDLDGTIVNSYKGITDSIKYVTKTLNTEALSDDILKKFIGPPLEKSFIKYCDDIDENNVEHAISLYREYYKETGIYDCTLYPNIIECLNILKNNNKYIYLATAKPKPFAKTILSYLHIDHFFNEVYGVDFNSSIKDKYTVMSHAIKDSNLDINASIMIGDREDDAIASKKLSIDILSVRYGYGEESEFSSSNYVADNVLDILDIVL